MTNIELSFERLRQKVHMSHNHFDRSLVQIGDFTYGTPNVLNWGEGAKCKIGKFCSIADNVTILLGGEHNPDWVTTYPFNDLMKQDYGAIRGQPRSKGDVVIENDVWIGMGARIMSGVHIGDGAVIGAYALVTKNVAPYTVVGGVPAKVIRKRFTPRQTEDLMEIAWWDWPIEKIAEAVPLLQSNRITEFIERYKDG